MSDNWNRVWSFLARLKHWLGQVFRRRFFPHQEAVEATGPEKELLRYQVLESDGHHPIAVVDLGRDFSDALRATWAADHPDESGGVIGGAWLQPLLATAGTASSSLATGNVFLATADPKTLMTIGKGVGSAVMGPGGIVKQAQFIPAGGALLPVVAPVMLFMTVSSLITGARLDRMQRALGTLSEILAHLYNIIEAATYAKFDSARKRLDDIWCQFEHSKRFTNAMTIDLALAKKDIDEIHIQFDRLIKQEIRSENDARRVADNINLFFLSGLMDIRADVLRLFQTLQDDPPFAEKRQAALHDKFEQTNCELRTLLEDDPIKRYRDELQRKSSRVPFYDLKHQWQKRFGGGLPTELQKVEKIHNDFRRTREDIEYWTSMSESSTGTANEQSVVVYRGLKGELHARHTQDLRLQSDESD